VALVAAAIAFSRPVGSAAYGGGAQAQAEGRGQGAGRGEGRGQGQGGGQQATINVLPLSQFEHTKTYMLVGDGGNVILQVGDDGALVVDTGLAQNSQALLATINRLNTSGKPLQYVIVTHYHPDHTGAIGVLANAGKHLEDGGQTAPVLAHENVLKRMTAPTGQTSPRAADDWPTDTYFREDKELYFNGEGIRIIYAKNAHTDGDSIVYFRKSDVIAAGDIFVTATYPIIDLPGGGNVNGIIDALNVMLDLAIPQAKQEGGTVVVPGHGHLCDEHDLSVYRDMVFIIRDRIADAIKRGQTLAQIKADKAMTLDYEGRYGATQGFWTTDKFLDAVYANLTAKK